jgi:hypothetical protein
VRNQLFRSEFSHQDLLLLGILFVVHRSTVCQLINAKEL